jgi:hypothetical protein
MIYPNDVREKFPEYSTLSDGQIQPAIDEAVLTVCVDDEPVEYYDLCLLYLTAHILTPSYGGDAATAGPVVSRTDGRVSVTFANLASSYTTGPHSSTQYGRHYDHLCSLKGQDLVVA